MYLKLIDIINKKMLYNDEEINEISKELLIYKNIYEKLKPKGKKFKKENIINLFNNPSLLNELINLTEKSNTVLIKILLKNKTLLEEHNKKTDEALKSFRLTKQIIFSDSFLISLKNRANFNPNLIIVYNKLLEMKKNDEKLFQINEDIVLYTCNFIIEKYESLLINKELLKENKKHLKYAKQNILSNNKLSVRDIICITNLINEENIEKQEKEELLNLLDEYIINNSNIDEKVVKIAKEKKEKLDIKYVDSNDFIIQDEEIRVNEVYYNYYITLKSLSSYNDVSMFLYSVKYDSNFKIIIENVISLLSEDKQDVLLKQFLINYLSNYEKENIIYDKEIEDNTILYYDFLKERNIIYSDITKGNIPKEYYNDIIQGLDMIKSGNVRNKASSIRRIKKVKKIRVNDIRITYKNISNNIYVILGIFCKKDNKGYDIISKTENRNNDLSVNEKSIIEAIKLDYLWDEYLSINSDFEKQIKSILKSKEM